MELFPIVLKSPKLFPFIKKDDVHAINNYRPISILPVFSKILEKVMYKRLYSFLCKHNILNDNQFGFRKGYSVDLALTKLVDSVCDAFNQKENCLGLFIDLSKAFDSLDHVILLNKLYNYGVRGIALQWFKDYLNHRKHFTLFQSCHSDLLTIHSGVPQGSILGPLLFLIYINDITNASAIFKYFLYADDTNLLASHNDLRKLYEIVNDELKNISFWFSANKLSVNTDKTKYMLFQTGNPTQTQTTEIKMNSSTLEEVHCVKFLGVLVDNKLSWKDHVTYITIKLSRGVGIINKLFHVLPSNVLLMLYNTLILPYLNYCIIVWGRANISTLAPLIVLQKRAIRLCTQSNFCAHTPPLFKKTKSLCFQDLHSMFLAMFMYNYTHNLLPPSFSHFFKVNSDFHGYCTRKQEHFRPPLSRLAVTESNSVKVHGSTLWNSLPNTLKNCPSLYSFKEMFKKEKLLLYK